MQMTSMKLDKKQESDAQPIEANEKYDRPAYPCGLCVSLDDDALSKLGIKVLPKVGSVLMLEAKVEVSSVSSYDSQGGGKSRSVSLQITDLGIGAGGEDSEPVEKRFYGSK